MGQKEEHGAGKRHGYTQAFTIGVVEVHQIATYKNGGI